MKEIWINIELSHMIGREGKEQMGGEEANKFMALAGIQDHLKLHLTQKH